MKLIALSILVGLALIAGGLFYGDRYEIILLGVEKWNIERVLKYDKFSGKIEICRVLISDYKEDQVLFRTNISCKEPTPGPYQKYPQKNER